VNVNADNAPPAEKVQVVGFVTMLPEVGLVRPKLGDAKQPEIGPASAAAKPLPETVTTVPTAPDLGLREIVGPVTVKVACPISPTGSPSTCITYAPGATLPIVNVKGFKAPLARKVHDAGPVITLPEVGLVRPKLGDAKQPEIAPTSAAAKPLPDTVTTVPTIPEDGVSLIDGGVAVVTVNVA